MTLPFLHKPAEPKVKLCGNEASGVLEFPIYGGLTVGESHTIEQMTVTDQPKLVKAAQFSEVVAKRAGITRTEAYDLVQRAVGMQELSEDEEKIMSAYEKEINEQRLFFHGLNVRSNNAQVIALVRCRLGLPDWNDLANMHKALYDDILELAEEEIAAENMPAATPPTEEELGKQSAAKQKSKARTTGKSASS